MARLTAITLASILQAIANPAFAQTSPFDTGANSLVDFALTIATPIAILVVIGAAIAAAVGRISWGWVVGGIAGIAAIFGSPQIVAWIRGMFGVGDCIGLLDASGHELARGLVAYDSDACSRIKGHSSTSIEEILGYHMGDAVIHRDDMVLVDDDRANDRGET